MKNPVSEQDAAKLNPIYIGNPVERVALQGRRAVERVVKQSVAAHESRGTLASKISDRMWSKVCGVAGIFMAGNRNEAKDIADKTYHAFHENLKNEAILGGLSSLDDEAKALLEQPGEHHKETLRGAIRKMAAGAHRMMVLSMARSYIRSDARNNADLEVKFGARINPIKVAVPAANYVAAERLKLLDQAVRRIDRERGGARLPTSADMPQVRAKIKGKDRS